MINEEILKKHDACRKRLEESEFLLFKMYVHVKNTREESKPFKVPSDLEKKVLAYLKMKGVIPA